MKNVKTAMVFNDKKCEKYKLNINEKNRIDINISVSAGIICS